MSGRRKGILPQFVPHTIEMLESPAYRALSVSGHRALARIEIEHGHHGGKENGRLPVTYDDFEEYGISEKSVAKALRELQALGFARITERGRPSKSDFGRHPNYFELTYIPTGKYPRLLAPTNEWKEHETIETAVIVAQEARKAKDEHAVARSRAKAKKATPRKLESGGEKIPDMGSKNHPKLTAVPGVENDPTMLGSKNDPSFYISGREEDAA